jgi:DNA-binding beta-propeller fold protein YncE
MADLIANLQAAAGAGGAEGWNISTAEYNPGPDAWNLSKAVFSGINVSASFQDGTITGGFFKPDGTKMYAVGSNNSRVYEYNLSSPWVVSTASFVQNFSVNSKDPTPSDLFFKPDGTKMYVLGDDNNKVYEYSLSTAWNISTASFTQDFSVGTQEANPQGLFFKPDGTKMYVCGFSGDDVNEYSLSTAWDISTASYVQVFSVSAQETQPEGVFFKPDGTKMYIVGETGNDINEYSLSTAWDISTASYVQNFSVSDRTTTPKGVYFYSNGGIFYVFAASVNQFTIGGFSVATQETVPESIFFKPDGTKMYILGSTGDDVNEYTLSTAWDVSTASYVQAFSVASQDNVPRGLFFKADGTEMYIAGDGNNSVFQYTLSTAWNVSTASYIRSFSVGNEELNPVGIFFKDDGTVMYVLGAQGDDVNEYSLSTAWNISTASYVGNFSVSSQDNQPEGLFFKTDGTKMYVIGSQNNIIAEYDLSTPWDISTATHLQSFGITSNIVPTGLFFDDSGTKLFVVSSDTDRVFAYTVSS